MAKIKKLPQGTSEPSRVQYLRRFFKYFEKTVFEKSLSGDTILKNVLNWVKSLLIINILVGIEFSLDSTVEEMFPQN